MSGHVAKRIGINLAEIKKAYKNIITGIFTALGTIALFVDLTAYVNTIENAVIVILVILLSAVFLATVWTLGKREKQIEAYDGPGKLSVEFGDIFYTNTKIRVIAVNRCFDMMVSKNLVSAKSLHGIWVSKYLASNTREVLDHAIERQLDGKTFEAVTEKKLGKRRRYPVGTVVEIEEGRHTYYLVAMTTFDSEKLTASCTAEDYCLGLARLMKYYNENGQQEDIALPLIGSGMSRIPKRPMEILQCMLAVIKMGMNHGQGNIKIVLKKELKEEISLGEIC